MNKLDVMGHLIPRLIEKGKLVHAYTTDAFWYDVGSTERHKKAGQQHWRRMLG